MMIDWEKQPNGKWKIKSESNDNWYWEYKKKSDKKKKEIKIFCEDCNIYYTLYDPCIHHLPDDFKSEERRKERKKLLAKGIEPEQDYDQQRFIKED